MELLNSAIKFYNLSLNRCIIVSQSSEYAGQLIRTKHRTNNVFKRYNRAYSFALS